MDYIFTEVFFDIIKLHINVNNIIVDNVNFIILKLTYIFPLLVKLIIGYCHFYYQLGYGLIFYIYLFRRRKSKKNKNWKSFYGNSVPNWILFNISILNKFILNKFMFAYLKNQIESIISVFKILSINLYSSNKFFKKIYRIFIFFTRNFINYIWTPVFKRSSYILFLKSLKRFIKRK